MDIKALNKNNLQWQTLKEQKQLGQHFKQCMMSTLNFHLSTSNPAFFQLRFLFWTQTWIDHETILKQETAQKRFKAKTYH